MNRVIKLNNGLADKINQKELLNIILRRLPAMLKSVLCLKKYNNLIDLMSDAESVFQNIVHAKEESRVQQRTGDQPRSVYLPNVTCFGCNNVGHVRRDCKMRGNNSDSNTRLGNESRRGNWGNP